MDLGAHAGDEFCYLTTTGRVSGRPHRIEIWFVVGADGLVFLMAGGGHAADWVRNLEADPAVTFELGGETCSATAQVVEGEGVEGLEGVDQVPTVRRAMVAKYQPGQPSGSLDRWGEIALPVAIRLDGGRR